MLYNAIQHISLFGVPTIRYERDRDTNFFLWVIKRETVLKKSISQKYSTQKHQDSWVINWNRKRDFAFVLTIPAK